MKKSFTLFSVSALFLMLLFPISVKAETCSNSLTIQCEDETIYRINSSLLTKGTPTPTYEKSYSYYSGADGAYVDFKGTAGEHYYMVHLPAATYSFTVYKAHAGNSWLNIWEAGIGNALTYDGVDYGKHHGDGYDIKGDDEGYQDKPIHNSTVSNITLTEGDYIIGLYGNEWAAFDKIVIVADGEVFCEPACTKHTVTLTAGANGSVSGGGEQCDGSVTVTATPNTGYRFVNWTNTSSEVVSTNAEYTFDLSVDISLTANFEEDPCTNSKTIQCEDYNPEITKPSVGHSKPSNYMVQGYRISGNDEGYGAAYGDAFASFRESGDTEIFYYLYLSAGTYTFTVRCSNGNTKKVVLYNAAGDTKLQELELGSDYDNKTWHEYTTSSWTAASSAYYYIGLRASNDWAAFDQMTITASSNVFCPYDITLTKSEGGSADPTATVEEASVTAAMDGTTVTVTAAAASAGYNFSGWTASPEVTFADASATSTTFTMPANAVTITANYEASVSSTFTYTTSGSGSITCATESGSSVVSGTPISMTAVPSTDYVFTGWTATAGSFSNESALTTTFTMPAEAATVTANFAQVDNMIITGSETTVTGESGDATLTVTSVSDFDAFNHNVLKFAYSDMDGKYKGQKVAKDAGYSSASSAGATGFGFYYKTEKADDDVAFCFDTRNGQVKWQLKATNNVWKYYYFANENAASWDRNGIIIYMNGDDGGNHTTYKNGGVFYMSEIAATTITSKPDIANYHYTNNRGGAMQVNEYGTLCLPMAGTISGATLYSVAGKETGDINYLVLEDKGTSVEAGKPYITQSTATSYTVTMSGAHSAVQDGNGLVGTYETITLTPYDDTHHNYFLYENAFKKAGTGVTVGAYRAYLNWGAVSAPPAQAPSALRIRMVIEGKEVQTGMETVTAMPKTTKVLIDGQLFIIREGKRYTLTGARAQ